MSPLKWMSAPLLAAPALVSCSFSFSAGGPDYEKLESRIADELNKSYSSTSREVSGVDCPRQAETPKKGDSFICKADLDGNDVRVQVTVQDDEQNVEFSTLDIVYDLPKTADRLSEEISKDRGFKVTVTCGEGLKVVEIGKPFDCTAADRRGDTRQVKVTPGAVGEGDHWELIGADRE